MNIIHIEIKNSYKSKTKNGMATIPIIKREYYENGEIEFEILGKQEVPIVWLNK
ncbi:hypothetical protein [Bacillus cereus]|uniref:hypothetical protein n=1 Tax=Bacillus cereus TaxID=1396 RepID=UPI001879942B|nr:hypothetical protein [Bacillus cereus]